MNTILNQIVADKRLEVERQKACLPLEQVRARCGNLPKCRNFHKAVTKPNPRGLNVIAEVKKASPSAGLIRPDFDPVQIARTYQRCGADAISVLTDEKYFQGRLDYLTQVKQAVSLPVLRKDFIIDPYQVYEARAAGADAILLIAEALKPADLIDLQILANQLTLTVLLEVHSPDTLLAMRSMIGFPQKHYSVLGINNRDLTTMKVDLNTTSRLAEMVEDVSLLVAESGIKTRADVEKLIRIGVGAVLIGQTLCESDNIEDKFRELFG
ncbi:MAG: indole-3-glycerol phosphate synthase TrpC [Sedimentisphaerales bacterium]|nr:indole-3-glycerol phosphate synthase TrpC [Sedimentisphaerales bacterium]